MRARELSSCFREDIKIRKNLAEHEVLEIAIQKHSIKKDDIIAWHIARKSIDARKKEDVHYTYSVDIEVKDEKKYKKIEKVTKFEMPTIKIKNKKNTSPIVIGAGPAGLFAALILVQNNIKPIIIEQGQPIEERKESVEHFLKTGKLNPSSNEIGRASCRERV